jgi:hypothetical protein
MSDKKPPEKKASFAESLLKKGTEPETGTEDPKEVTKEWQPTAQAFILRLWYKDGHHCESLPWTLFSGDAWRGGDDDKPESLKLIFGTRVVTIHGYNLKRLVEKIDDGRLKSIPEHDSREVALIRSQRPGDPAEIRPAIVRIEVDPPFEEFARAIREGDK